MNNGSNLEFENEVKKLYELFHKHEESNVSPIFSKPKLTHPESKRIGKRYILFPFFLAMLVAVTDWIYSQSELSKIVVLLLTLVGYVGIMAVQLMELYAEKGSILQFLKNPLVVFTNSLVEDATMELKLLEELKKFSGESLELLRRNLEAGHLAISHRIGILVGAMEKIGILPGLITLYIAASSNGSQRFAVFVALAMFAIYVFSFTIHQALPRLHFYKGLIEFELVRRKNEL